jgi:hypothetical protein
LPSQQRFTITHTPEWAADTHTWFEQNDSRRSKPEDADFVAAHHLQWLFDFVHSRRNRRAIRQRRNCDSTHYRRADHNNRHATKSARVGNDGYAIIAHEQLWDVTLTNPVHWKQIAGNAAHDRDFTLNGRMYSVIVAWSQIYDCELATGVARCIASISDQFTDFVVLTLHENARAWIDATRSAQQTICR